MVGNFQVKGGVLHLGLQWTERALLASEESFASRYSGGPGGFLPWHPAGVVKPTGEEVDGAGGIVSFAIEVAGAAVDAGLVESSFGCYVCGELIRRQRRQGRGAA